MSNGNYTPEDDPHGEQPDQRRRSDSSWREQPQGYGPHPDPEQQQQGYGPHPGWEQQQGQGPAQGWPGGQSEPPPQPPQGPAPGGGPPGSAGPPQGGPPPGQGGTYPPGPGGYGPPQGPGWYGPPQGPGGYGPPQGPYYGAPYGGPQGPAGPYDAPSSGPSAKVWAAIGGGAFLVVVIVVAVVLAVVLTGSDGPRPGPAAPAASGGPTASEGTGGSGSAPRGDVAQTVATPPTAGGLQRLNDPALEQKAAEIRADLAKNLREGSGMAAQKVIASYYQNPEGGPPLFLAGAEADMPVDAPSFRKGFLEGLLSGFVSEFGQGEPQFYPSGSRGGQVACVQTQGSQGPVSACGWATDDTFAVVSVVGLPSGETLELMRRMRPDIERPK